MGYGQQDSSEFLSLLLDLLHEDLNRIIKKPYIELDDYDGTNEEKLAKESWDIYNRRNKSVISEHFAGQFKSLLKCNKCNYVSIT
jgi:ubiquitin carboxyl-terminal hydrolase 4/11/15